jgi:hypothetical protein
MPAGSKPFNTTAGTRNDQAEASVQNILDNVISELTFLHPTVAGIFVEQVLQRWWNIQTPRMIW